MSKVEVEEIVKYILDHPSTLLWYRWYHIKDGIRYTMIKKGEMRIVVNGFSEIPKRL